MSDVCTVKVCCFETGSCRDLIISQIILCPTNELGLYHKEMFIFFDDFVENTKTTKYEYSQPFTDVQYPSPRAQTWFVCDLSSFLYSNQLLPKWVHLNSDIIS